MSVPVWKRKIAERDWFRVCSELYNYTINKVKNEKYFPKRYWKISTERIVEDVRDIKLNLVKAYFTNVKTKKDYEIRFEYQRQAYLLCMELLVLLDDQYADNAKMQSIDNDEKVIYWVQLIESTIKSIKTWVSKEKITYKSLR